MDTGRKDLGDKATEKVTPESSKSTTDKISEGITDTTDKIQRQVVPDDQKSGGQSFMDKAGREKDSASGSGDGIFDQAKNALGMGDKK
ncbi:hypothetical protein K431DRAFT_315599 [Polychaeton citri CBS 116435]|uniref:Chaperone/heat shock protein Hsp12 n=1 Tax=Polychaeton citri CBS 116435 TaxID=1314669 RepID=A0A9P4Q0V3_9PEZI|nr:hypothetical protein K431DRAFT_315599 [Polychaeton citri CBS 116435]